MVLREDLEERRIYKNKQKYNSCQGNELKTFLPAVEKDVGPLLENRN